MNDNNSRVVVFILFVLFILSNNTAQAQNAPAAVVAGIPVNYDESKVGTYTLPDPLVLSNGQRVSDAFMWKVRRRLDGTGCLAVLVDDPHSVLHLHQIRIRCKGCRNSRCRFRVENVVGVQLAAGSE